MKKLPPIVVRRSAPTKVVAPAPPASFHADGTSTVGWGSSESTGHFNADGAATVGWVGTGVISVTLTQNLTVALTSHPTYLHALLETIRLTDSRTTQTHYHYVFTDTVRVRPTPIPGWNAVLGLLQNLTVSQALSEKFTWGRTLTQALQLSDAVVAGGRYLVSLMQLFKLADILGRVLPMTLNQNITVHPSPTIAFGLRLLQKFLVVTSSSPVFTYHLALAGRVVVQDILDRFMHGLLAQLFTVHDAPARQFVASNSLAQLLTVHPALTNKLVLQIIGNIQLSPSQLVHMIYKGDPLLDGVIINALYISPSGTTTTWAVNTRTNAVTEYMNYNFRSFALLNNRYIAAGSGGLYELEGDTDAGTSIVAELMSGYLQLNEKKLFGIKGAYVAIRGGGRFYLKLISGDGREYTYELRAQPNLMTTKVKVGKGLSTTYMAFDLMTEGQDFDLDSIEFIPMTRGRRV